MYAIQFYYLSSHSNASTELFNAKWNAYNNIFLASGYIDVPCYELNNF